VSVAMGEACVKFSVKGATAQQASAYFGELRCALNDGSLKEGCSALGCVPVRVWNNPSFFLAGAQSVGLVLTAAADDSKQALMKVSELAGIEAAVAGVLSPLGVAKEDVNVTLLADSTDAIAHAGLFRQAGDRAVGVQLAISNGTFSQSHYVRCLKQAHEEGGLQKQLVLSGVSVSSVHSVLAHETDVATLYRAEADQVLAEVAEEQTRARLAAAAEQERKRAEQELLNQKLLLEEEKRRSQLAADQERMRLQEAAEREKAERIRMQQAAEAERARLHELQQERERLRLEEVALEHKAAALRVAEAQQAAKEEAARMSAQAQAEVANVRRQAEERERLNRHRWEEEVKAREQLQRELEETRRLMEVALREENDKANRLQQLLREEERKRAEDKSKLEEERRLEERLAREAQENRRLLEEERARRQQEMADLRRQQAEEMEAAKRKLQQMEQDLLAKQRADEEEDARLRAEAEAEAQRAEEEERARQAALYRAGVPDGGYVRQLNVPSGDGDAQAVAADGSGVERLCFQQLQLFVGCRNLLQMDWFTMVHPVVAMFARDRGANKFVLVGQTEVVHDKLNPDFETPFTVTHRPGERQELLLRVYDCDRKVVTDKGFIGQSLFDLDKLTSDHRSEQDAVYALNNPLDPLVHKQLQKEHSVVYVRYQPAEQSADSQLELTVRCFNIPQDLEAEGLSSRIVPVASMFLKAQNSFRSDFLGQTEKHADPVNPTWRTRFLVDYTPGQDWQQLKISVFDTNTDRVTDGHRVGSATISLSHLHKPGMEVEVALTNDKFSAKLAASGCVLSVSCTNRIDMSPGRDKAARNGNSSSSSSATPRVETMEYWETDVLPVPEEAVLGQLEEMMTEGRSFRRFFSSPDKKHQYITLFYRGNEPKSFYWCAEGDRTREEHASRRFLLHNVCAVVKGKQAAAFDSGFAVHAKEDNCFSIYIAEHGRHSNVLHLEARHANQREAWIFALLTAKKAYYGAPVRQLLVHEGQFRRPAVPVQEAEEEAVVSSWGTPAKWQGSPNRQASPHEARTPYLPAASGLGAPVAALEGSSVASPPPGVFNSPGGTLSPDRFFASPGAQGMHLQLKVEVHNLPSDQHAGASHNFVVLLFEQGQYKCHTEQLSMASLSSHSPPVAFSSSLSVHWRPDLQQEVRLAVYDIAEGVNKVEDNDRLGSCLVRLDAFAAAAQGRETSTVLSVTGENPQLEAAFRSAGTSFKVVCTASRTPVASNGISPQAAKSPKQKQPKKRSSPSSASSEQVYRRIYRLITAGQDLLFFERSLAVPSSVLFWYQGRVGENGSFFWNTPGQKLPDLANSIRLSDIVELVKGKPDGIDSFGAAGNSFSSDVPSELVFSLVSRSGRRVELACSKSTRRDTWVYAITYMLNQAGCDDYELVEH